LIADANGGFSLAEAHGFLDALAKAGMHLDLFEQPVAREALGAMGEIRRRGDTLVAADESCRSLEDAKRIVEREAADVLNIKLAKSGVLGGMAIHRLARESQLGLMIGGMVETRIGMGFAAHFAAGLGGFDWIDLDTPQLLAEDPVLGGTPYNGPIWQIQDGLFGHGALLDGLDLF
jgi:L-alanine-DL-glutamate epimerase-like enolase superfamily enzyme